MIRTIMMIFFANIIPMNLFAQIEDSDTLNCGKYGVIISLPTKAINRASITQYEEGYFKDYPLEDGLYISFHYGGMTKDVVKDTDTLIYECRCGNVTKSREFIRDYLYFRTDDYFQTFSVSYLFANKINRKQASIILDNIMIIKY